MSAYTDNSGVYDPWKTKFNPIWAKRLVLAGVAMAIAGALFNMGADHWNQHQLDQAVKACQEESAANIAKATASKEPIPAWASDELVCGAKDLEDLKDLRGVQLQVSRAKQDVQYEAHHWGNVLYFLGGLTPLPWLWYWFLRRLREVKQALTDK
jgi:hypothetical protein